MTQSDRQRRYVARKREAGLCGFGGCPNLSDGFYCDGHKRLRASHISVPPELKEELEEVASCKNVTVPVLTEVLLQRGLKEMRLA